MTDVIVSAADEKYHHLLLGLVLSLRALPASREMAVVALDVGMTAAQREALAALGVTCVAASLEPLPPRADGRPPLSVAQRLRPQIPRLVPGYGTYLWMDADLWVQRDWVVPLFLRAAGRGAMAIVPEVHVAYPSLYGASQLRAHFATWRRLFDQQTAEALARNPTINSGLFALRGDAPHWDLWAGTLQAILARDDTYYGEQLALNHLLYTRPREAPARFLAASCNWICHQALPVVDHQSGLLCDPVPPYPVLGAVHLTVGAKEGEKSLRATDGGQVTRSLKYRGGAY